MSGDEGLVLSRSVNRRQFIILYKPCQSYVLLHRNRNFKSLHQPSARSRCPSQDSHVSPTSVSDNPTQHPSSPGTQPWHTLSMANYSNQPRNSSSNYYQATKEVAARSNIQASAYTVDAVDMALKGFHYSTCGAGGTYLCAVTAHSLATNTTTGAGWWV